MKCRKKMNKTDAQAVEEEVYYSTIPALHPNPITKDVSGHSQGSPPELPANYPASNDGCEKMDMIENEAYVTRGEAGLEIECNTAM